MHQKEKEMNKVGLKFNPKSKPLNLEKADKEEFRTYIELQRGRAISYGFRLWLLLMFLWIWFGALNVYKPELLHEALSIILT